MKKVPSREMLLAMECEPFNQDVLYALSSEYAERRLAYPIYQCICRYFNFFAECYGVPTDCRESVMETLEDDLKKEERYIAYLEDSEDNNSELLFMMTQHCGWPHVYFSQSILESANIGKEDLEHIDRWRQKLACVMFSDISMVCAMKDLFECAMIMEDFQMHVICVEGLAQYLNYRERNQKVIMEQFRWEDRKISKIVGMLGKVMMHNETVETLRKEDQYLVGWLLGSDGCFFYSYSDMNPNWLVSMYILHGLLWHAKKLFGYQEGGGDD